MHTIYILYGRNNSFPVLLVCSAMRSSQSRLAQGSSKEYILPVEINIKFMPVLSQAVLFATLKVTFGVLVIGI